METLEIRLLVDSEVKISTLNLLECLRQQVIAPGMYSLGCQSIFVHDLGYTLRTTGINRDHPFEILMAQVVSLDRGEFTLAITMRDDLSNEIGTAVQKVKL